MGTRQLKGSFKSELRKALHYLYDPINLRSNLLAKVLFTETQPDPGQSLRALLIDSIEALKPSTSVPPHSEAWRIYTILLRRYIEQFSQREVASEMNLSERHLRREDANALTALGIYLWEKYDLDQRWPDQSDQPLGFEPQQSTVDSPDITTPTYEQELDFLQASLAVEPVNLSNMVENLLQTIKPLARTANVRISYEQPKETRFLAIKPTIVRQALLISMSSVISSFSGNELRVEFAMEEEQSVLCIRTPGQHRIPAQVEESLPVLNQLLSPSGGVVEAKANGKEFALEMHLPLVGRQSVLVIDDNNDTQLLLERYLTGTNYQFIGTRDSDQGLDLARRTLPKVIVLDVMMPGVDGWELLGRLREHPQTKSIPVVVCTILPQENLALTLGAAAFLRKPVNREAFLAVLDRLVGPSPKESG